MSLHTINARLGLLLFAFFLLVTVSVGTTLWGVGAQENDSLVINLAGRQRMLAQQMTMLALTTPNDLELFAAQEHFETTLRALRDGGETLDASGEKVTLPPAPTKSLRTQLDEVAQSWTVFTEHIGQLRVHPPQTPGYRAKAEAVRADSRALLLQLEAVVSEFEAQARAKVARLRWVQGSFLFAALVLLTGGGVLIHRQLLVPLRSLHQGADRIGRGDLRTPVSKLGRDELGQLATVLERMRAELAHHQRSLETRVLRRTRELTEAFEFSREIVTQFDVQALLRSVTERSRKLMGAQEARICLLSDGGRLMELAATDGSELDPAVVSQPRDRGMAARVVVGGQAVMAEAACVDCGFLGNHASGQCVAAPLKVGESTLGALCVVRETQIPFNPDEIRALTLLANTAAIAIANARSIERERQQAQRTATLAERERIAAELHDNLAQTLGILRLKTEQVGALVGAGQSDISEQVGRIQSGVETAYHQVRAAMKGGDGPAASGEDFSASLAACMAEFESLAHIPVEFSIADPAALMLPDIVQTQVLHIIRESLANVYKHAGASQVEVLVACRHGATSFLIQDDGCGFQPERVRGDDHLGLKIMRTRAERSGGQLEVHSVPGKGTRVKLLIPMDVKNL